MRIMRHKHVSASGYHEGAYVEPGADAIFFFTTKKESYLRIQLTLNSQQKHFRSEGLGKKHSE